jgi:hypothetical protein
MEAENAKLEAEVERMQAVLAADKSLANAAHRALASASENARSWSENLGARACVCVLPAIVVMALRIFEAPIVLNLLFGRARAGGSWGASCKAPTSCA